jgi:hypothetical protein
MIRYHNINTPRLQDHPVKNPMNDLIPFPGIYQVAYVTNDLDQALAVLGGVHGVPRFWQQRDMPFATGQDRSAVCHIGLAFVGAVQIEVIEPREGDVSIYRDWLTGTDGFALRFHHLCRLFDSEAAYDQALADLRAAGRPLPICAEAPGMGRYFYADYRPELGHYLEGIVYRPQAQAFLDAIPHY